MTLFNSAWTAEAKHSIAAYLNRRQRLVARLASVVYGKFIYDGQ